MSTNKDILLGLVCTLSDNECRDVLYFITDREYEQSSLVEFGLVHITKDQYNKGLELANEIVEKNGQIVYQQHLHKKESLIKAFFLFGLVKHNYHYVNQAY